MHEYKKLKVWQEAMNLVIDIYRTTGNFPKEERYGIVSQINRSAVSIPSNIAEGAGRNTKGEFKNLLSNAYGSSCELETQLTIAYKVNYINEKEFENFSKRINAIQKMIYNLINTLK